jgi:cyclic pyranopterin phosphate synthase
MKLDDEPHSTSLNYRIKGHAGTFGLIGTLSQPFCSDCNRLRITADGKLKNCLFSRQETDLLTPLRQGREIQSLIADSLRHKAAFTGGQPLKNFSALSAEQLKNRSMIDIGG